MEDRSLDAPADSHKTANPSSVIRHLSSVHRPSSIIEMLGSGLRYVILLVYLAAVVYPLVWVFYTSAKSTQEIYAHPFAVPRVLYAPTAENSPGASRCRQRAARSIRRRPRSRFANAAGLIAEPRP